MGYAFLGWFLVNALALAWIADAQRKIPKTQFRTRMRILLPLGRGWETEFDTNSVTLLKDYAFRVRVWLLAVLWAPLIAFSASLRF